MIYLTSDTHFFHCNIIKYCNRPFMNEYEMNRVLVQNWNERVKPEDTVYHLGDFGVGVKDQRELAELAYSLNGNIFLLKGNHENAVLKNDNVRQRFNWIRDYYELKTPNDLIVLFHYALRVWNKSHHGALHAYGHSHGSLPDDINSLSLDVGVDCWNYKPITIDEFKDGMKHKTFKPIDHHTGKVY